MNQNRQFEDVIRGLTYAKDSLDSARYSLYYVKLYRLIRARAPMADYEIMTSSRRWTFSLLVLIDVCLP
jgi:hypothetical protein